MMCVMLEGDGDVVLDRALDRVDVFAGANARAVANAKDMGVDGLRRMPPPHVQHHIGGLATNAGQRHEGGAGGRYLPIIEIDQHLAELDHVLGLVAIQPDGFDMLDQTRLAQRQHLLRRVGDFKQLFRGLIDAHIRRLRGQRHGDHQSIGVGVVQLALGLGLGGLKPRENLVDRGIIKLLGHAGRYAKAGGLRQGAMLKKRVDCAQHAR